MYSDLMRLLTRPLMTWVLLGLFVVLTALALPLSGNFHSVQKNDAESFLPPDAASTQVIKESAAFADPSAVSGIVVYTRETTVTPTDVSKAVADALVFAQMDYVEGDVIGPLQSKDGKALQVIVTFVPPADDLQAIPEIRDNLQALADRNDTDLNIQIAGPLAFSADQSEAFAGIDGTLLYAALGIVFVVLLITYRSIVIPVVFLAIAGLSLVLAQALVYVLADRFGLTVNSQSAGILNVLVIGAGVDYALLLVARYREELLLHERRHDAMAEALKASVEPIVASAATVILGLLCLVFASLQSTAGLGPVAASGIVFSLITMLLLLPAVLLILGRWIFWPFIPRAGGEVNDEAGFWARTGWRIEKNPRRVWVVTALLLAIASLGIFQLNATGLDNADSFTTSQPSVRAEETYTKHFDTGDGSPLQVVANESSADQVAKILSSVDGLLPGSAVVRDTADGRSYIEATLTEPPDSEEAFDTVDRAREALDAVPEADAKVGGGTAVSLDVRRTATADNLLIIPIILAVVFFVLMFLLRSIVAPIVLLATVVLSYGTALGLSALTFHYVFGFAGTDNVFPLFVFVFLVALGIDYNIFLMTRVREESLLHGTHEGALIGLGATGGVITSAGMVLAGTFAALGSLPVVVFAEVGFAVALGVILDTIIVRSVLVTALTLDLGRWMWWPSKLWRTDGPLRYQGKRRPEHSQPVADEDRPSRRVYTPSHRG